MLSFYFAARGAAVGDLASPAAALRRRPNSGVRYYFVKILVGKCSHRLAVAPGAALVLNLRKTQKNAEGIGGAAAGRRRSSADASEALGMLPAVRCRRPGPGPARWPRRPRLAAPLVVSFIYLESDVYFICARRACLRREDLPSKALNVRVRGPARRTLVVDFKNLTYGKCESRLLKIGSLLYMFVQYSILISAAGTCGLLV